MTGGCLWVQHPQWMQGDTFLKTPNTFRMFGCLSYFVGYLEVCGCENVGRGRCLHNNKHLSLPSVLLSSCLFIFPPLSYFFSFPTGIVLAFLPLSVSKYCLLFISLKSSLLISLPPHKQMRFSDGLDTGSFLFPWHKHKIDATWWKVFTCILMRMCMAMYWCVRVASSVWFASGALEESLSQWFKGIADTRK